MLLLWLLGSVPLYVPVCLLVCHRWDGRLLVSTEVITLKNPKNLRKQHYTIFFFPFFFFFFFFRDHSGIPHGKFFFIINTKCSFKNQQQTKIYNTNMIVMTIVNILLSWNIILFKRNGLGGQICCNSHSTLKPISSHSHTDTYRHLKHTSHFINRLSLY